MGAVVPPRCFPPQKRERSRCWSLPASDPSPGEVMSFELREARFERQNRMHGERFGFWVSGRVLESLPRLGSDRLQASYSLRSPLRGRTSCVTPLRYVPTAGSSESFPMQKGPPGLPGGPFCVRSQASGIQPQAFRNRVCLLIVCCRLNRDGRWGPMTPLPVVSRAPLRSRCGSAQQ